MKIALLSALVLAMVGCDSLTYVVVRVDSTELTAADVQSITVTITNPTLGSDGGNVAYQSQSLRLCGPGESVGCHHFPLSINLTPGNAAPTTSLRVEVDGFGPTGAPVTSDAAVLSFTPGVGKVVDFELFRSCLGSNCAESNLACGPAGSCHALQPHDEDAPSADMAVPTASGEITRISINPGTFNGASLMIPPPVTQPGDLVLLSIYMPFNNDSALTSPAGWHLLTQVTNRAALLYRFAGEGEASQDALYHFLLPPNVDGHGYAVLVYRGARTVRPGTSIVTPPVSFASVNDLAPGGVVVGMLAADNVICDPNPALTSINNVGVYSILELRPTHVGPTASVEVTCNSTVGGNLGQLFQTLLEP